MVSLLYTSNYYEVKTNQFVKFPGIYSEIPEDFKGSMNSSINVFSVSSRFNGIANDSGFSIRRDMNLKKFAKSTSFLSGPGFIRGNRFIIESIVSVVGEILLIDSFSEILVKRSTLVPSTPLLSVVLNNVQKYLK